MKLPAEKPVAVDKVAEQRSRPLVERLEKLRRAPQTRVVTERIISLSKSMVEKITELSMEELTELSGALIQLIPGHSTVYRHAGTKISQLLQRQELVRIREDQTRLVSLFAGGPTVGSG